MVETVKLGKTPAPKAATARAIRDQVFSIVKAEEDGIGTAHIFTAMNATSDADKTRVHNAIADLISADCISICDTVF